MANITQAEAQHLLDASNGTTAYTNPTGPVKVRLTTSTPTSTSAGTEVSGGSYAAQSITFSAASAATPSASSNSGTLTYTSMPATTVTGVDEFDSNGTPFRRWFGLLTAPKTLNSGDTFSFSSTAYAKTLG